jgi:hypothetical protein
LVYWLVRERVVLTSVLPFLFAILAMRALPLAARTSPSLRNINGFGPVPTLFAGTRRAGACAGARVLQRKEIEQARSSLQDGRLTGVVFYKYRIAI